MTFRENANLSAGQVRRGGGRRRAGGTLAAGGGVGGLLLLLLYLVFGGGLADAGDGGLATGSAWDYDAGYVSEQGSGGTSSGEQFPQCRTGQDANERLDCRMVGTVISVQDFWASAYRDYRRAETVIFEGSVNTACGAADSSVGPFYCPVDSTIYLDVSFFSQLERMGADGGSLSQMYVVAHEYGHHVQNLTGALAAAQRDQAGPESGAVRVELQADCYAGVWVAHASQTTDDRGQPLLEPITAEQVESALSAAEAVGDDRIQQRAQGRVDPDVWTHGSAEQRQRWFTAGYDSGDPRSCNTLDSRDL